MHRNLTCGTWCRTLKNSPTRCLWWLECRTWYQYGLESILSLLVSYNGEFLDDDFGTNQMWNIGYQKSCPVVQTHSMCQAASVRRGLAQNENLESLLVDCCDSIPLLEVLLNLSWNSSALAFPAFVKWAMTFSQLLTREFVNPYFLSSLHFSHLVHTSNLRIPKASFITNSSCSRICSLRDSTYPWWTSCNCNRWA